MSETLPITEHPTIKKILSQMRISEVVASRTVTGQNGETHIGFSAEFLDTSASGGLTPHEAKVAAIVLGLQVDRAAHQNAWAGGNLTQDQRAAALASINQSYGTLLLEAINEPEKPRS